MWVLLLGAMLETVSLMELADKMVVTCMPSSIVARDLTMSSTNL